MAAPCLRHAELRPWGEAMSALVGNAFTELAKAEAEIARLEKFIASRKPGTSLGAERMAEAERAHAQRVRNFLRSAGVEL
jgi:hypothetical protein